MYKKGVEGARRPGPGSVRNATHALRSSFRVRGAGRRGRDILGMDGGGGWSG